MMAWREPDLQIEILREFAGLGGDGWAVPELGSPYDPDEPELTIEQRVRRRREEFQRKIAGRKKAA